MVDRIASIGTPVAGGPALPGVILRQLIRNGATVVLDRLNSDQEMYFQSVCDTSLQVIHYCLMAEEGWSQCRQIIPQVAPRMEQFGYREDWLYLLEACLDWAQREEDTATEAEICRILGHMQRLVDRYAEAERWLQQSVAAYMRCGDRRQYAVALNQLGRIHHLQHRYEDALACASKALAHLRADDPERAESHFVLGMVALSQRRWAEAEVQQKLALDFRLRSENARTIAWAYHNLGFVYLRESEYGERKRLQEADEWLRRAADMLERLPDPYHLAVAQNNLGAVQERFGNYHEALRFYQQASAIMQPLGGQRTLAQIYNNVGLIYLRLSEPEKAENAFRDGVAIYLKTGDHQSRLNTQHGVVLALLQQKRFDEAAELCERSLAEIECLTNFEAEYKEKRDWYTASLQKARQGIL